MLDDLKNNDEIGRLKAVQRLNVLDTAEEAPFEKIVNLVQEILQVPICAVTLVDEHRQWFKASRGLDVCETSRDVSFCSHAIQFSEPFIVQNAVDDPRFAENPLVTGDLNIRGYAGIPLRTPEGYNVGALCAIDTSPREFLDTEIAILEKFAKVIIDELELRQIASSDHLTGALSRRAWMEKAELELVRAKRYNRPLSLAILDIDKFKLINDTYGHPAGDKVIKFISELCTANKRDMDLFGRLGGEEFALIMPETDAERAKLLIERVRALYGSQPIELGDLDDPVNSTFSAGIAELGPEERELDSLIERADKALYRAKNSGRNCTIIGYDEELASADEKKASASGAA